MENFGTVKMSNDCLHDTDGIIMHMIGSTKIVKKTDGMKVIIQYSADSQVNRAIIAMKLHTLINTPYCLN